MDKNDVGLTILASAILVGAPLIASAIQDFLSGRSDEQLGGGGPSEPADAGEVAPHLRGRPIEQLAADLRRLRRAVATDQQRSATHQLADRVAYDQLLMQACGMLAVPHDLAKTTAGPERDIERLRVEPSWNEPASCSPLPVDPADASSPAPRAPLHQDGPSRRVSFDLAAFQAARQPATVTPSTLGQLAPTFACDRSVRRASDRPNAAVGRLFVEARLPTRQ